MASTIYIGLAVSSHLDGVVANATFENTAIAKPTTGPAPPTASTTIRVMHWNLYHGQDANKHWAFPRQMDIIANAQPDVISLNEVEKFNSSYGNIDQAAEIAKYLATKTGTTWYQYMVPASGSTKGIGNAIISRFPLDNSGICQLSRSRNAVRGSMTVNGRAVSVWSAHLSVESSSYRVTEAKALLACMAGFGSDRIVAGDFNANTGTTEISTMTAGHIDGWPYAKSIGAAVNYPGNCDGCTRKSRIDYIFLPKDSTHVVLKKLEILDTRNASGVMASDHKPMVATIEIK
jgi:endonuclease/exonuclease/phosphatase family metal-dependent hydrolase